MKCYTIEVNGKTFNYQEVYHKSSGHEVIISEKSLEEELIDKHGAYKNEYAKGIDEKIYGYVDDNLFSELSYEEFEEYVNKNFD